MFNLYRKIFMGLMGFCMFGISYGHTEACTTILVGRDVTANDSWLISRTTDFHVKNPCRLTYHPSITGKYLKGKNHENKFTWDYPETLLGYSSIPLLSEEDFGSAGFNDAGVGISATETIFPSNKVLAIDPFDIKKGINECSLIDLLLPQIHTAKEGVKFLGKCIEKYGCAEGFGVAFVDKDEIWYLETASSHHWLAQRLPANKCFGTANQGRLRDFYPEDKDNFLASPDLIEFAVKNGLYKLGTTFDFHTVFMRNEPVDNIYNHIRVERLAKLLTGKDGLKIFKDGDGLATYWQPNRKLTIEDLKALHRDHYDGTKNEPYLSCCPNATTRPIAVFRQTNCHILEVRPNLPREIGEINYVAFGMADLGLFLPYYAGLRVYPDAYSKKLTTNDYSSLSAAWHFRHLQTLVMQDYPRYAPMVKKAYANLEKQITQRQQNIEKQYLRTYKMHPQDAAKILQDFEWKIMQEGLDLTDELIGKVIYDMSCKIEAKNPYSASATLGAKNIFSDIHPDAIKQ